MAKKVFILGAGASASAGPPLMAAFLDAAHDLLTKTPNDIAKDSFRLAFDFLGRRLPLLHARSVLNPNDVEAVFNIVEMAGLVGRLPGTEPAEIPAVANAFRRVLADTIESNCLFPIADGHFEPTEDYGRLAAALSDPPSPFLDTSVAFLTFNYDTALDFALHFHGHTIDYGFGPPAIQADSVPLLKLHGSLNWALCPSCKSPMTLGFDRFFQQTASPPAKFRGSMPLRVSRRLPSLGAHCDGASPPSAPAIVPPSWNKTQYHEIFRGVWTRAAAELAEAEDLYILGYSFPPTDSFFRELLALGLAGGARIRTFTVVDPNEAVATRIRALLGPDIEHRFVRFGTTFSDFLSRSLTPPR